MDNKLLKLQTITSLILLIASIIGLINAINILKKKSYTENLEEKLNIYEEDYDRYCLEDSLRQTY